MTRTYLVGSVGSHRCCKDNGPLDSQFKKCTSSGARCIEGPKEIDVEEILDLLLGKVQSCLVVCSSSVSHHSMQSTGLGDDLVQCSCDGCLFSHIGIDCKDPARITLSQGSKFLSGLANID